MTNTVTVIHIPSAASIRYHSLIYMNDNIFFVSVSICNTLTLACRFSPPPLFFLFCIPSCVITEKEVSNHFDMKKGNPKDCAGQCILNFLFIGSNAHSASLLFFISYMYLTIQHIIQNIFIKPSPFQQRCSCFWILFHKQTFFIRINPLLTIRLNKGMQCFFSQAYIKNF